jgi:PPM family protein phosphatase
MRLPPSLIRSHSPWSELPESVPHPVKDGPPIALRFSGRTDKGHDKKTNQDHIATAHVWENTERSGTLMVLADGLGGHRGGEVASMIIAEQLPSLIQKRNGANVLLDLVESIIEVHELIQREAEGKKNLRGMCSTAVVALVIHRILYLVHVGDSRGYLFRDGRLVFRTRDHSLKESPNARASRSSRKLDHVLTQSVGVGSPLIPGIAIYELAPGDRILLCSDGISDFVGEEEMRTILSEEAPDRASQQLLDRAITQGSTDDVSVIVASAELEKQ